MVSRAAAMLPRWLVNVSWLTRDLPPTITHSHPLFTLTTTLTPLHHGPAFSSLSFFLHHRFAFFHAPNVPLFHVCLPLPSSNVNLSSMLAFGKVFAKQIRGAFHFRSRLNADSRVFRSTMFARPAQRSSSLLTEFSLFPSSNDAR